MLKTVIFTFLVFKPLRTDPVLYNSTTLLDSGRTTLLNESSTDSGTTNTSATVDADLVETTCHIISEKLVATATATVSSAFKDLCTSDHLSNELLKMESRLLGEILSVKLLVEKIGNVSMDGFNYSNPGKSGT